MNKTIYVVEFTFMDGTTDWAQGTTFDTLMAYVQKVLDDNGDNRVTKYDVKVLGRPSRQRHGEC